MQKIQTDYTESKRLSWKVILLCSFESFDDFNLLCEDCYELPAKIPSFDFFFPPVTPEDPFPSIRSEYLPLVLSMSLDVDSLLCANA